METSNLKLLAIDDNQDNLRMLKAVVREALSECALLTATNGLQGIELARTEDPDVILLDIVMPGMDGFEVCRRLKADEQLRLIPVVFLTAIQTGRESRVRALEAGAEAFLAKPLDELELVTQIRVMARLKMANRLQRTEEALQQTQALLKIVADGTSDAVFVKDIQGRYLMINSAGAAFVGKSSKELVGKDDTALFPLTDALPMMERDRRAMASGITQTYEDPLTADGTARVFLSTKGPVHDAQGKVIGLFGIARDITERKRMEQALADTRDALKRILDLVPDMICTASPDGHFLSANPAFEKTLGYSCEQLLGASFLDLIHPEDRERTRAEVQKQLAGQPTVSFENRYRCKDGTYRTLEWHATPATGGILYAAARDITERKKAEERLRESNELFSLFMRHSPFHTYIKTVTPTESRVLQASDNFDQMIGISGRDMLGKTMAELFPAEMAAKMTDDDMAVVASGKVLKANEDFNGRHYSTIKFPIVQGGKTLLAGFTIDVTEHRQAEEALRKAHSLLAATLESTTDGILVVDTTGKVTSFNRRFLELWRIPEELIATRDDERLLRFVVDQLVYPKLFLDKVTALYHEPDASSMDELAFKDGRIFERYSQPQRIGDANVGRVWSFRDITARKRAEVEEERLQAQLSQAHKMESVGRLAGGVAHDFNNLLTGIVNYVDLCRSELPAGHPIQCYLDEITSDAQRSASLIRQLLAFARKQTIAPRALDLNDAVAGILGLIRRLIGEDINLVWRPCPGLCTVKLDPSQVDQLLTNLCVNAREAIANVGAITIETVKVTVGDDDCTGNAGAIPGDYVMLIVSDTGSGIEKDVIDHIFEPFFTTKAAGHGTGLGLATVYGIVKQNDGFIDVSSEPGKGASFRIYLPCLAAEGAADHAAKTQTELPRGSETVLLVEDENSVRITTHAFLDALGYAVLDARDPEEALRLAAEQSGEIQLMITDVIMPGMSGRDLAQRLLESRPAIKLLFISGFTADVIAQRGILDDGLNFLPKPFTRDQIAHKVREVLDA